MRKAVLAIVLVLGAVALAATPVEAAPGRLAVMEDLHIDGPVRGDAVAVGGNVVLGPEARVDGHAVAVFGRVEAAPGATVSGERISITSLAGLELGGASAPPRLVWGVHLLTWGFWLVVTGLLAAIFPSRIVRGAWNVRKAPAASLGLGLLAALTRLAALVAVLSAGPALGLPGAVTLLLVFAGAKVVGITLLAGVVGDVLLRRLIGRRLHITVEVFLGAAVLLALRTLPVVGGALWALTSTWGLGATVLALAVNPLRQISDAPLAPEE
ncbi:MAG TPA: hypothetical protein ENK19_04350 [Acidobacteria bacterium]|nr:hypothetical protein [Acidobacteriota bacterium]